MQEKVEAQPRTPLGRVFTFIGVVIVIITLAIALFLALPSMLGWTQLTVLSGSMEPSIPVGSMVYIEPVDPASLEEGDVITYTRTDGETVTHRVVSNRIVDAKITTKGDANTEEDVSPIPYSNVEGKVAIVIPGAGDVLGAIATGIGKLYLILFGACGVMFVILGGRLRKRV